MGGNTYVALLGVVHSNCSLILKDVYDVRSSLKVHVS